MIQTIGTDRRLIDQIPDLTTVSGNILIENKRKKGRYLDFGFPVFNDATLGLDHGVVLFAAPPNTGKSMILQNFYSQIIMNNPDAFVLDFSLDDSVADRINQQIARIAKLPINWIKIQTGLSQAAVDCADMASIEWRDVIRPQLEILDETYIDNTARNFSTIRQVVREVRQVHGDKKLIVAIDGFHNIQVDTCQGDEYAQAKHLSTEMKNLAETNKAIILASAHTPKKSMRRGLDQDSVKGAGNIGYDAKIICTLFSDVNTNRGRAEIYHDAILPHSGSNMPQRLPVIELDVAKNKAGSFKDLIMYRFYPEYAYLEEAPAQWQASWKKVIYGQQ
jgi:replicative DNA helicase